MKLITNVLFTSFSIFIFSLSNSFALTNSTVAESPEFTNVLQIRSDAPDASGESIPGFCNATLINQHAMVTAAHCIKLAYISGQKKIGIQVGNYKYITRKTDGKVVRVGYVVKHNLEKDLHIEVSRTLADKFSRRGEKATIDPSEDFAILWWNEELPEFADIQVADIVSPLEHNTIIKNIGQYIFQPLTINPFSEMSTDTKRMATISDLKWKGYVFSKAISRVEEGDSGAPLFVKINNKLKVFAVVKGKASTVFDNWDAYSAVNPHLCQIAMNLPTFIKIDACK